MPRVRAATRSRSRDRGAPSPRAGSSRRRRRPASSRRSRTRGRRACLRVERQAFLVAVDAQEVRALARRRTADPRRRVSSPRPGCSILITRAPMSASSIVQYGPESTRVKSRTVTPSSGGGFEPERGAVICFVRVRCGRMRPVRGRRGCHAPRCHGADMTIIPG